MKQQRRYKEPQDTLWGKFLSGFMAVVFAMSTLTLIPIASAINGEPNEAQIQQQEELADQTSGKDEKAVEPAADEQKLEPVELLSIASVEDEDDADDAAPADVTLKVKAQNATVTYNGNDVATELVVPADKDVKFTVKAADGFTLGAAAVKLADAKGETTLTPNAGEYTVAADRVADGATIVVTAEAVAGSTNTDAVEPSTPAPSTDLGEKMETAKSVVTDILANAFGTSALAADTGISPQSINGGKDLEIYVGSTTEIRSNNNNNRWVQNQTWSSADESIANVSGNESSATVTGNAIGTTTITYSYQYWSGGMIFGKWVDQTEKIKVTVVKAPQASLDEPVYVYAQVAYSNGVTTDLEGEANELLADLSVNKKGWYTLGKIDNAMVETPTVTKVDGKDVYEQASEADTNRVVGMLASMEKTDNHSFPTDKIDIGGWSLHGADGANDFSGVTPSAWHLDGTVTIVTYTWKDELAPDNAPLYGPVVNWASSVPENNVEAPHHDGYVFDKWVSTTDKDGDVTITATYVVDEGQTKDLAATVDYSYGGTVDAERHVDLKATVQLLQPDTLSTAEAPAKAKDGYRLDSITVNGTAIEGTTIPETVSNGDKVVYVYVVDEGQTKDLAATVDYSYGGTVDAERHVDLKATVQLLQPDTLSTAEAPAKAKDGYRLDSITVNGTAIEGTTIPETVSNGDKVVYVYVVDEGQTKDLAATVDYSYGGTVDAERHVDLKATVQLLQPDTLSTAEAPAKAKDGYRLDSITVNGTAIEGTTIPETVSNGDKVVYVYVRDSFPYTVNYVDENGNALLDPKTGAPQEFESLVSSSDEVIAIKGYVFERANTEQLVIGAVGDDNIINLTYAVDVITDPNNDGNGEENPGDGIPDKYQAVVNYESANDAQGTVNLAQKVITFANNATSGTVNIFDGVVTNPTAGFVFDGWIEGGNAVASNLTRVLQGNTEYTFIANWALDVIGTDPTDPGNNAPDGIADKYQLVVTYAAIAGTIDGPARYVLNKYDAAGNLAEDGVAVLTAAQIPGATADDGYGNGIWNNEPLANMELTDDTAFVIVFTALPAAAPDATPAAAAPLAPVAAAAPAAAAAAAATILDDGVPLATIDDDENALAAFEEIHCWTHWLMIFGALVTIVYGLAVLYRRRHGIRDMDDFEGDITGGRKYDAAAERNPAAGNAFQAM